MLYISDLDFTLLRSDLSISNYTKDIWNKTASKHKLSIATARSFTGVKELLKGLTLKQPLILLDGVIIANIEGKIYNIAAINKKLGDEILFLAKKHLNLSPLIVAYEENSEVFIYPKNLNRYQEELIKTMKNRNRVFSNENLKAKDLNLKIVFQANEQDSIFLQNILKENLGDLIEIKRSKDPYIDCYFITVLHPLGDKAHALKKLEEIENISIKNTTVFGDSHNDLGLFEVAGTKVAVANAIKELKEKADIILPHTNDEDAVAKFLEKDVF